MAAYGGLHCPDILTKHYGQIHKRSNKLSLSRQTDKIYIKSLHVLFGNLPNIPKFSVISKNSQ